MLTTTERALTPVEVRSLAGRLDHARRESGLEVAKIGLVSLFAGGGFGWLAAVFTRSSSWVFVPLCLVLAVLVAVWIDPRDHRTLRDQIASLDDAMRASRVRITRVQSSRVVEFEEKEDEGNCYAFAVDASTCLFIVGREFHTDDFPNSDFSIVQLIGTHGRPVDTTLEKTGGKVTPERVITPSVSRLVEIPEHMTTVDAAIEVVEHALGKPKGRGYA